MRLLPVLLLAVLPACGVHTAATVHVRMHAPEAAPAEMPDAVVQFAPGLLEFLDGLHARWKDEVILCLIGEDAGDRVRIWGIEPPRMLRADSVSATSEVCPKRTLGLFHNHPGNICEFSVPDLVTYEVQKTRLALVSCGAGHFSWRLRQAQGILEGALR